jgi:hypothetical protein
MTDTLGDALPRELARVRKLAQHYRSLDGGVGVPAAILMELNIDHANKAMIEDDLVGMIREYKQLVEWKG